VESIGRFWLRVRRFWGGRVQRRGGEHFEVVHNFEYGELPGDSGVRLIELFCLVFEFGSEVVGPGAGRLRHPGSVLGCEDFVFSEDG
jgi:hypothetical protein